MAQEDDKITRVQELAYVLRVKDIMTRDVVTVCPADLVSSLRAIFAKTRVSGAPVMSEGKLVGIVSIEDYIKCLLDGSRDRQIGEVMTDRVMTLRPEDLVVRAIQSFERSGFGRLPVVAPETGEVVGIVTKSDIIKGLLHELGRDYHAEELHRYRASHIFEDIIADDATVILRYEVVARDVDRAGSAATGLKKTLSRLGVAAPILRRIGIATYEAEMNVVFYSEGGSITAYVKPDKITIVAKDEGPGIPDIHKALEPGWSTATEWVRSMGFGAGMGLPNIKKCSDEMKLSSEVGVGTELEIAIHWGREGQDQAA